MRLGSITNFNPTLVFAQKEENKGKHFGGFLEDEGKVVEGKGIVYQFKLMVTDLTEADIQRKDGNEIVREPFPVLADGSQSYSVWLGRKAHGMIQMYIHKRHYGVGEYFHITFLGTVPTPEGPFKGRPMKDFDVRVDLDRLLSPAITYTPTPAAQLAAPAESPLPELAE